jgi:hypothetical protein
MHRKRERLPGKSGLADFLFEVNVLDGEMPVFSRPKVGKAKLEGVFFGKESGELRLAGQSSDVGPTSAP